jgi:hypothetical protein
LAWTVSEGQEMMLEEEGRGPWIESVHGEKMKGRASFSFYELLTAFVSMLPLGVVEGDPSHH